MRPWDWQQLEAFQLRRVSSQIGPNALLGVCRQGPPYFFEAGPNPLCISTQVGPAHVDYSGAFLSQMRQGLPAIAPTVCLFSAVFCDANTPELAGLGFVLTVTDRQGSAIKGCDLQ